MSNAKEVSLINISYKLKMLKYNIKCIPSRTKRVLSWIPVVWRSEDWDYGYLIDVMRKKIDEMEMFFSSDYTWTLHAKDHAKEMRMCLFLIDRIQKQNYCDFENYKKFPDGNVLSFSEAANHERYMFEQDKRMLFNIMEKKISCWWD